MMKNGIEWTLRKKFVFVSMTTVTLLILILVGAINLLNYNREIHQSQRMIEVLAENEMLTVKKEPPSFSKEPRFQPPPISLDDKFSARYFLVCFNEEQQIVRTDISRISAVREEKAQQMAEQVLQKGKETGQEKQFLYHVFYHPQKKESAILFLDLSARYDSMLGILLISFGLGLIGWIFMLMLVVLLSKRAILPIIKNIERQKQFITNAGHEIKTPLAIIIANTDAMELCMGENKWSKNIRAQAMRLNELMQTLLTLAKMEESEQNLKKEKICLSNLLEEQLKTFQESMQSKSLIVLPKIQPEIYFVCNRDSMIRLFCILLDNAEKYTNEKGKIELCLERKDKKIVFQIKNSCESLPYAEPEQLFERFYRGDSARTQKNGGYGIGLSAAKEIVRLNQGSLTANYETKQEIHSVVFTAIF